MVTIKERGVEGKLCLMGFPFFHFCSIWALVYWMVPPKLTVGIPLFAVPHANNPWNRAYNTKCVYYTLFNPIDNQD